MLFRLVPSNYLCCFIIASASFLLFSLIYGLNYSAAFPSLNLIAHALLGTFSLSPIASLFYCNLIIAYCFLYCNVLRSYCDSCDTLPTIGDRWDSTWNGSWYMLLLTVPPPKKRVSP